MGSKIVEGRREGVTFKSLSLQAALTEKLQIIKLSALHSLGERITEIKATDLSILTQPPHGAAVPLSHRLRSEPGTQVICWRKRSEIQAAQQVVTNS